MSYKSGDGQADRRRAQRGCDRRQGGLRHGREGFCRSRLRRHPPRIPLYQPFVNVAMQKNISGYQYWFHRRLDYRAMVKVNLGE